MIIAESKAGIKVHAKTAERKTDYYCCLCKERVIFKKGQIKIPHFSHVHNSTCSVYSEGETWEHLKGKSDLYDWLEKLGYNPELEVYIAEINQRADILLNWKAQLYAIEYQCSPISEREVIMRTQGYQSLGIKPIWIAGCKVKINKGLSVLNRLFIIENEVFGRLHFYYNTEAEQLEVTYMSDISRQHKGRRRHVLNKNETSFNGMYKSKPVRFYSCDEKSKNQQSKYLHKMRHYNVRQYRSLFELMYKNNLTIDCLPRVVYSEVVEEWTINTYPVEWKLHLLLWLKGYSRSRAVITLAEMERYFLSLINQNKISCHFLPNLRDNSSDILSAFLALLEFENYLFKTGENTWRINRIKYNW